MGCWWQRRHGAREELPETVHHSGDAPGQAVQVTTARPQEGVLPHHPPSPLGERSPYRDLPLPTVPSPLPESQCAPPCSSPPLAPVSPDLPGAPFCPSPAAPGVVPCPVAPQGPQCPPPVPVCPPSVLCLLQCSAWYQRLPPQPHCGPPPKPSDPRHTAAPDHAPFLAPPPHLRQSDRTVPNRSPPSPPVSQRSAPHPGAPPAARAAAGSHVREGGAAPAQCDGRRRQ